MKPVVTLLMAVASFMAHAQVRLTVVAADSLPFLLSVDEQVINLWPCTEITAENIPAGKHVLKLVLNDGREFTQAVTCKENNHVSYGLKYVKNTLRIVLDSEMTITMPVLPAAAVPLAGVSDSIPSYSGATGCPTPISDVEFASMKQELGSVNFETRRFELLKGMVSSRCLSVDQLRYLLSRLDMEDNKIRLLEAARDHIFDIERLPAVEEDFFLEKNKARARTVIAG